MIEQFLARDEGKTLEFKENCRSMRSIVRSAVAFANTAGRNIVIGVRDKTKQVAGVADPLVEEERLAQHVLRRAAMLGNELGRDRLPSTSEFFAAVSRPWSPSKCRSLGLIVGERTREVPTNGAVLLFEESDWQRKAQEVSMKTGGTS